MTELFSTAYLPPIQLFAVVLKAIRQAQSAGAATGTPAVLWVEGKETFPKQTYRNRAMIATAGGMRTLTVPVIRHNHSRTEEVLIDYKERWNIIHQRTLEAAYGASPYYLYYKDDLEVLLTPKYERLVDLNDALLKWLLRRLKIDAEVQYTDEFVPTDDNRIGTEITDYRYCFSPKIPYPTEGMPKYYQVFGDRNGFIGGLSVVDLLMNLGPEARGYLESMITEK